MLESNPILELGWNPEIEFDEATRVRVDRRVNNIINECGGMFLY